MAFMSHKLPESRIQMSFVDFLDHVYGQANLTSSQKFHICDSVIFQALWKWLFVLLNMFAV